MKHTDLRTPTTITDPPSPSESAKQDRGVGVAGPAPRAPLRPCHRGTAPHAREEPHKHRHTHHIRRCSSTGRSHFPLCSFDSRGLHTPEKGLPHGRETPPPWGMTPMDPRAVAFIPPFWEAVKKTPLEIELPQMGIMNPHNSEEKIPLTSPLPLRSHGDTHTGRMQPSAQNPRYQWLPGVHCALVPAPNARAASGAPASEVFKNPDGCQHLHWVSDK